MDGFFYILFEYEFYYNSVTLTLVGKARMRREGKVRMSVVVVVRLVVNFFLPTNSVVG